MVKRKLAKEYALSVEIITCDNDEFGHVDLLLITKSGNKYIIKCLSDLERIQMNMSTKRFDSEEYHRERYKSLDNISFLTEEELRQIDEDIGYYKGMYMDEVIDMLGQEFVQLKDILREDENLR